MKVWIKKISQRYFFVVCFSSIRKALVHYIIKAKDGMPRGGYQKGLSNDSKNISIFPRKISSVLVQFSRGEDLVSELGRTGISRTDLGI